MGSRLIVGFDGSPASDQAVRWAAHEAEVRGVELTVVYVHDRHLYEVEPHAETQAATVERIAWAVVDGAVATAREVAPAVEVRGLPLFGPAAGTLVNAAGHGSTTVVGNRGRGGFRSLLLGSVSEQVATHAAGPVVVVRGRADAAGPIVVSIDGSPSTEEVLGVAIAEADFRHTSVNAIWAYPPLDPTVVPSGPPYVVDTHDRREAVAPAIERWRTAFPDIEVNLEVVEGEAAKTLIDASSSAQLVVVGARGRGGFAGLRLGSVGLQLLHHAHCPVLVVRP